MTGWNWLLVLAVVSGWILLFVLLKRRTKQIADKSDQQTQHAFELRLTRLSGITSSVTGAAFVGAMLFSWRSVPAGNEPFAIGFFAFGLVAILYGAHKLYRLPR
jgi:hypothetical protein